MAQEETASEAGVHDEVYRVCYSLARMSNARDYVYFCVCNLAARDPSLPSRDVSSQAFPVLSSRSNACITGKAWNRGYTFAMFAQLSVKSDIFSLVEKPVSVMYSAYHLHKRQMYT